MAIFSKLARPVLRVLGRVPAVTRPSRLVYKHSPVWASSSTSTFSTSHWASGNEAHGLSEGINKMFGFDYHTMPVAEIMDSNVLSKLMEYSTIPPTPLSIEEFMAMGTVTEEASYNHLKMEVAVRLAHMIMELQHLPRDLHAEEKCYNTIRLYSKSFSQIIEFEEREPDQKTLVEFMEILKTFKSRHADTVGEMALACMRMKERLEIQDELQSHVFTSIKTFLDRLYTSRISIHMITNQHLIVHGYERTSPNQIGIIHPNTCITSILVDAYDDALFYTENYYMAAPKINIKNFNSNHRCEPAKGILIPSHLYNIFYEVFKNSMRATVETHWDKKDNLPPIEVIVCQANDDFTIKISDQGGGVDRVTVEKMFYYLYSTDSKNSNSIGYGLPLSRLYARYFQGDLKIAAYEGFGTDVYIYTKALASSAVERLPVYNKESVESWVEEQDHDWTSSIGTDMMQASDKIIMSPEVASADPDIVQPKP